MVPKRHCDVAINGSLNVLGEGAKTVVLSHQTKVVKVGEGWIDLESGLLIGCWVAK